MRTLTFLALVFTTCVFTACDGSIELPVTVAVYPGAENCTVKVNEKDEPAPAPCASIGTHLRDQLKVPMQRQIDVSMFRMEKTHNEKDIDRVAEVVRAAGYTDVKVWRFGLE